jgi:pantoate--beta-alanine ligase
MRIARTLPELRSALAASHAITLVPTMGNLHAGHLSLVRRAREREGLVAASIFVNPLQFGVNEDFATYPRTFDRDCELLSQGGCDVVFAPDEATMYPEPQEFKVAPPERLAGILEGAVRPGFFVGVCTVVLKLFTMVQPAAAVFGKKDYQQLRVIQNMTRQLALPVEIVPGETVREPTGLALSSRNSYLSEAERAEAPRLQTAIGHVATVLQAGHTDWPALERDAMRNLAERGWQPDYVAIRTQKSLGPPSAGVPLVVLGAARLGRTRLIDNVEVSG